MNFKKWAWRGLATGLIAALSFVVAQVATYTTMAQLPTTSPGGSLNLISDSLMFALNTDSHGTRQWFFSQPITKPPLTGWSTDNGAVLDTTFNYPFVTLTAQAGGTNKTGGILRTAPTAPYTVRAQLRCLSDGTITTSGLIWGCGIYFRESATDKRILLYYTPQTATTGALAIEKRTNQSTTSGSNYYTSPFTAALAAVTNGGLIYLQQVNDGVNLSWNISTDGNHWSPALSTQTLTDFFTVGPNQIGVLLRSDQNGVQVQVQSWYAQ